MHDKFGGAQRGIPSCHHHSLVKGKQQLFTNDMAKALIGAERSSRVIDGIRSRRRTLGNHTRAETDVNSKTCNRLPPE